MSQGAVPLACTAASAVFAGVFALVIGACPPTRAAEDAPIKINATELVPVPNPALAFNTMAQTMGLFAKHGLAYEPGAKLGDGGPTRIQAVATGSTEVAVSDIISVLGALYSGAKIKVLMAETPYGDGEIWGRNEYKTLKDAEGKAFAVASLGGAQRFNAQMAIEGMGLPPDAFRWTAIAGTEAAGLEATVTGRTQIVCATHLGAELIKAKGYTKQIHPFVEHTAKYTPPIPRLVVVATDSWIKSHPEAATRYVETMLDLGRRSETNPDQWVAAAVKIFKESGMTKQQLRSAWQKFHDGGWFSINGGVNFAATEKIMALFFKMRNESPNAHLSKPTDVYDTGPLKKALDKMGLAKGTPSLPDTPDWYKKG